jgi:hypothetical protein
MVNSIKEFRFPCSKRPIAQSKTKAFYSALAALGFVFFESQALAIPVDLGAAGPQNWTVLEIGLGNVSMANASKAGSVIGNVGINGGNLSDSGVPIQGNIVTSSNATVNPNVAGNVTGTISQNSALLASAATAADNASTNAAALPSSGGPALRAAPLVNDSPASGR